MARADRTEVTAAQMAGVRKTDRGATLLLDIGIVYHGRLADSRHERDPVLDLWFSKGSTVGYYRIPLRRASRAGETHVPEVLARGSSGDGGSSSSGDCGTFRLCFESNVQTVAELESRIIAANLNIKCFTEILSARGDWARNQAGEMRLAMVDVLGVATRRTPTALAAELSVTALDGLLKGTVELRVLALRVEATKPTVGRVSFDLVGTRARAQVLAAADALRTARKTSRAEQVCSDAISEYTRRCIDTFEVRFEPTWAFMMHVHAYVWWGHCGIVPAAYFDDFSDALNREAHTAAAYWLSAFASVARRHGHATIAAAVDGTARGSEAETLLVCEALTYYVEYTQYVADEVDTNCADFPGSRGGGRRWSKKFLKRIESFDCIRTRDCGDCEDSGREVLCGMCELRGVARLCTSRGYARVMPRVVIELFGRVLAVLDDYYFSTTLAGVSSAALSDTTYATRGLKMGAHEYAIAIPRASWWKWIERGDPQRRLSLHAMVPEAEKRRGAGRKVLVLEGTGRLCSLLAQDHEAGARRALFSSDPKFWTKQVGRRYYYGSGDSNFYKTNVTLFSPEMMSRAFTTRARRLVPGQAGYRYPEFTLVRLKGCAAGDRQRAADADPLVDATYSVKFLDLVLDADHVALVPQPPVPDATHAAVLTVLADEHPLPPLEQPPTALMTAAARFADGAASELATALGGAAMDGEAPFARLECVPCEWLENALERENALKLASEHKWLDVFLRYDQLTEARLSRMTTLLRTAHATPIAYVEAVRGETVGGVRVRVFVPSRVIELMETPRSGR